MGLSFLTLYPYTMRILLTFLFISAVYFSSAGQAAMKGAWQTTTEDGQLVMMIVTDEHLSMTRFTLDPNEFIGTLGGKWERVSDDSIRILLEYNTNNPDQVGQENMYYAKVEGDKITGAAYDWSRLDNGGPGDLAGAWVITGRKQGDEMRTMTPGARKTMKILSGTRFQWIAYNSETGEFMGTGGGTYSTENGKYTEHIQFFSRDNNRVGASLEFDYDLKDGEWHHSGLSSRGDPIYEIWSRRSKIGI